MEAWRENCGTGLAFRPAGGLCHAKGVERLVRNSLWTGRSPERLHDAVE